jgi:hypothetical protein
MLGQKIVAPCDSEGSLTSDINVWIEHYGLLDETSEYLIYHTSISPLPSLVPHNDSSH